MNTSQLVEADTTQVTIRGGPGQANDYEDLSSNKNEL